MGLSPAGLYDDPRVTVIEQSGRVFARRLNLEPRMAQESFDLAIVALTDPHRPVSSGAYSLTEDYNFTVDSFADYLQMLGDDGLLVVNRWLQTPPSESARTFGAIAEALRSAGIKPEDHLIAFRTLRTMTIMAGRQPVTAEEIDIVRDFLESRNFDAVYFPGIGPEDLNRHNVLAEPEYHELFDDILDDPETTYAEYPFEIRPPTDNRPFFFHYFKWRQTPEILAGLGMTWQPFGGSGYFVLVALLILVSLASAVFIIGPLLINRFYARSASDGGQIPVSETGESPAAPPFWRWRVFVYFACLGLAFLFVEVPLAQRFILILDQPVTALAVVLFAILLFSGIGSLTVRRWRLPLGLGLLIILIVLYPLLLDWMTAFALGQPAWARIVLTILVIAPLGYLMGLPFTGGLQVVEKREASLIPWTWAINGSFSVVSSVLAVMVALSWGFSAVLWLGAVAYAGALIAFGRLWK